MLTRRTRRVPRKPSQAPAQAPRSDMPPADQATGHRGKPGRTDRGTSRQAADRPGVRRPRGTRPRPRKQRRPRKRQLSNRLRNRARPLNRAPPRSSPGDREGSAMARRPSSTPVSSSWEALGTSAVLRVTDPRALGPARAIVERELEEIDRACSRFRADSDLQRVNAGAGRFVPVSPLLIEAVQVALRAAELTDGDVDPTVGNALVLAGYDRDWRLVGEAGRWTRASGVAGGARAHHARMAGDRDRPRAPPRFVFPPACAWIWAPPRKRGRPIAPRTRCTRRRGRAAWSAWAVTSPRPAPLRRMAGGSM